MFVTPFPGCLWFGFRVLGLEVFFVGVSLRSFVCFKS